MSTTNTQRARIVSSTSQTGQVDHARVRSEEQGFSACVSAFNVDGVEPFVTAEVHAHTGASIDVRRFEDFVSVSIGGDGGPCATVYLRPGQGERLRDLLVELLP